MKETTLTTASGELSTQNSAGRSTENVSSTTSTFPKSSNMCSSPYPSLNPALPALEGKIKHQPDSDGWVFEGMWAMNPAELSREGGITSSFKYKRHIAGARADQPDGTYSGYFFLQLNGTKQQVEETGVELIFDSKTDEVCRRVTGTGKNVYGNFELSGVYDTNTGIIALSKEYVKMQTSAVKRRVKTPKSTRMQKRSKPASASKKTPAKRKKINSRKSSRYKPLAPVLRGNFADGVWKGVWALSTEQLENGHTQAFEYHRRMQVTSTTSQSSTDANADSNVETATNTDTATPSTSSVAHSKEQAQSISGIYDGFFMLQTVVDVPSSVVKYEENGINFKFEPVVDSPGLLQCLCVGKNALGEFELKGQLDLATRVLECTKGYVPLPKTPRPVSSTVTPRSSKRTKLTTPKALANKLEREKYAAARSSTTPKVRPELMRARSGRKRKAPRHLREDSEQHNTMMIRCSDVLRQVSSSKHAALFLQPVDHVALNIPDYPIIIKHPMDLGTIRTKLDSRQYSTPRDFEHDMKLVFSNAVTYNKPGSYVYNVCLQLKRQFQKLYAPVAKAMLRRQPKPKAKAKSKPVQERKPKPGRKFAPRKKRSGTPASTKKRRTPQRPSFARRSKERQEIDDLKKQLESLKKWQLEQMAKPTRRPPPKKKRAPPKPKTLTQGEKHKLSQQIKMLPGDKLTRVLKIISEKMPISHNNDQEEIVIDMEALDTATLRQLQKYVRQQSNVKKNANPARMQEMARKMNEGTQERIDYLKQMMQQDGSDSSSDSSFESDSDDSGEEEILQLGSTNTFY